MELVLASHNAHKIEEFATIVPNFISLQSLTDIGLHHDIPENGTSFQGNALIKAKAVFDFCHKPCFSDDSGLVIPALNGEPGIYSARYSETGNPDDNIQKVLDKMEHKTDRSAYFICVICYYDGNKAHYFEGKSHGTLRKEREGTQGFGYDSIFVPKGYEKTFATMLPEEKNAISHRAKAVQGFVQFLTENFS